MQLLLKGSPSPAIRKCPEGLPLLQGHSLKCTALRGVFGASLVVTRCKNLKMVRKIRGKDSLRLRDAFIMPGQSTETFALTMWSSAVIPSQPLSWTSCRTSCSHWSLARCLCHRSDKPEFTLVIALSTQVRRGSLANTWVHKRVLILREPRGYFVLLAKHQVSNRICFHDRANASCVSFPHNYSGTFCRVYYFLVRDLHGYLHAYQYLYRSLNLHVSEPHRSLQREWTVYRGTI